MALTAQSVPDLALSNAGNITNSWTVQQLASVNAMGGAQGNPPILGPETYV